ncbi:MAG: aminotransferase class V-fold PLP-dependent enzyme, partial [Abditibacteriota bacterium]|nr:aminotransferase class V-fold PLP-dependent enzyme [Abditibacteriota bacterium]
GNRVITDKIEHHAVLHSFDELKRRGFDTTIVGVDSEGFVSPAEIEAAVTDKTTLITVMHANNEIGTIQPVKEIAEVAHAHGIHFHPDTVQTVGHIPVDVKEIGCDSLAISAHKFYGPKGIGAFYLKKGSKPDRLLFGGAQEKNRRPGTQNVPGIVGMGFACERAMKNLDKEIAETKRLQTMLIEGIEAKIVDSHLNGSRTKRLPGNVNFSFDGVEGESMILFLDMEGICVSSGSACTSGSLDPSHVLMALGLKHEQAHGSLRMTLGKENTEADVKKVLEVLPPIVARLREMSPLYNK